MRKSKKAGERRESAGKEGKSVGNQRKAREIL